MIGHRLNQYAQQLKQYNMEHGVVSYDAELLARLQRRLQQHPLLTDQIVIGDNLRYLSQLDVEWLRKVYRQLKIDAQQAQTLYWQMLLRWEILSQAQRVWEYVKSFQEECRSSISEEYLRGIEIVTLPNLAFRYETDQVFFNGCVLPLKELKFADIEYTQKPQEFELNTPGYSLKQVSISFHGQSPMLLIDVPGKQTLELKAKYASERFELVYTVNQRNQQLFKPKGVLEYVTLTQSSQIRQVYQLEGTTAQTQLVYNLAKPHIAPTHATYEIERGYSDRSSILCSVTGLQKDIVSTGTTSTGTIGIDPSGKDPLTITILYGAYNPSVNYLTGQHVEDGEFVQYTVWNGSQLPTGVRQYRLHSLVEDTRPDGLCVLRFTDYNLLSQLNQVATTYQYMRVQFFEVIA